MFGIKLIQTILIVLIFQLYGSKGDAEVYSEAFSLTTYDKEYFSEPDIYMTGEHEMVFNISIIKQLPTDAQVHYELLGASLGEYVIPTGIDAQIDLCEVFNEPMLLGPLVEKFGFNASECPPSIGVYGTQGYLMSLENIPDGFPPNEYVAIAGLRYGEKKLIEINSYVKIR